MNNKEKILDLSLHFINGEKSFEYMDMYYGSKSIFEFSRFLRIAINSLLNGKVIEKATASEGFHFQLAPSKEGSFVQHLVLWAVNDAKHIFDDLQVIGLEYFLLWAIKHAFGKGKPYLEDMEPSKSKDAINKLDSTNKIIDLELILERVLKQVLLPMVKQKQNIELRLNRKRIYLFDYDSYQQVTEEIICDEIKTISVMITKFNARTGTGRIVHVEDRVSYSFIPNNKDSLSDEDKILISKNLVSYTEHKNETIMLDFKRVSRKDGRLKRYILVGLRINA